MDAAREQKILNRMPLHAYGDTRDLGKMAEFLVGDGAAYITGHPLNGCRIYLTASFMVVVRLPSVSMASR